MNPQHLADLMRGEVKQQCLWCTGPLRSPMFWDPGDDDAAALLDWPPGMCEPCYDQRADGKAEATVYGPLQQGDDIEGRAVGTADKDHGFDPIL